MKTCFCPTNKHHAFEVQPVWQSPALVSSSHASRRADFVCLCCRVVKCARWCFYVQESAQVFVGHRRLQARLHLAAIKLRESGWALRWSTAGACSRAGRPYTN